MIWCYGPYRLLRLDQQLEQALIDCLGQSEEPAAQSVEHSVAELKRVGVQRWLAELVQDV